MRIAFTATGTTLGDELEPRFGRAPYFLLVDTETRAVEAVPNPGRNARGGAGIQSAQLVADRGAGAVLTGNCGPNAFRTLQAAGIEVIVGLSGVVGDLLESFLAGELEGTGAPNVDSHFGMR